MSRGIVLLALIGAACSDRIVALEVPPLGEARSAIFAFHGPDSFFEARAIDLEGDVVVTFPVDLDRDAEGEIEALGFERTLAELGLSPGRIDSVPGGSRLDAEDELFVASFRGTEAGAWMRREERSNEVDELRIPVATECTKLTVVDSFVLDSSDDHGFTIPLASDRVVVGQIDGKIYVIDPSGPTEVTDIAGIQLPLYDAVTLSGGTYLFSSAFGRVFSARITTSTTSSPIRIEGELLSTLPDADRILKLAGGNEDGELEIFALTASGVFYRYFDGAWKELHRFGVSLNTASDIVRARPGLAYASTDEKAEIVRYKDGVVGPFTPPDLVNGVPAMELLDPFGLVASRSEGGIYRLVDDSNWDFLEGSPISLNVYAFYSLGDSFLLAGTFGFVSEWRSSDGYCPAIQLGAGAIREITPFNGGLLFGEDRPPSREKAQVTLVRLER